MVQTGLQKSEYLKSQYFSEEISHITCVNLKLQNIFRKPSQNLKYNFSQLALNIVLNKTQEIYDFVFSHVFLGIPKF